MTTELTAERQLTEQERQHLHTLYKEFHQNPELSMQEHRTAERIERELTALGISSFRCGGTGVVGIVENGDGPVVAFRADTDALPIEEATGLEYSSEATGTLPDGTDVPVMHGCGHDSHITGLLGAAQVLLRNRETWSGTLVLIFQPGEETAAGAAAMIEDGIWDKAPRPEVVLGQHVSPGKAGTVDISAGPAMAMADSFRVTVTGRQTHGSQPQNGKDPIVAAAAMVTRLQSVVSRELSPLDSAVVTVGTFHAGLKENIIPETAEFSLNIRSLDEDVRSTVLNAVERIINAEAAAAGLEQPQMERLYHFPLNYNDETAVDRVLPALQKAVGAQNVAESKPRMGSEDFGLLGSAIGVPSVFWFFGGTPDGDPEGPVNHSPYFAPVIEPTLTAATDAAVSTLLAWLGRS
ncbi:amidohydrolase [Nesterenkonia sp. MY13]|uniref:Amidohydrolase n=1 Tax=Nesterenkonia sedimenti TaxID=1463632 RepID=A0A7X8TJ13_9MICC|nr:amidohydrolase [Nesterenkonia sedimenti]